MESKGTTLIELIIYISLLSILLGGIVLFMWDMIYSQKMTSDLDMLVHSGNNISSIISREVRTADSIQSVSNNNLQLTDEQGNTVEFYLDSGRIYISDNGNSTVLSSNILSVSNLRFEDNSSSNSSNISFSFDLENGNKNVNFKNSVEVRN